MRPRWEETSVPLVLQTPLTAARFRTSASSGTPHPDGVSNDEFRAAMSRLAAGVVLVTAHDADDGPRGEDVGMTATAFMSVSLDPPLVLVSLRNGSRMDDLLAEQPLWAVSLLSESQRHIAGRFAMKGRISDRLLFEDIPYRTGRGERRPAGRRRAGDPGVPYRAARRGGRPHAGHRPRPDGGPAERGGRPADVLPGRYRQLG